jgi:hypothetical protein
MRLTDSLLMNGSIFCANFGRAAQGCTLGGGVTRTRNRTHCLRSFGEVSSPGNGCSLGHLRIVCGSVIGWPLRAAGAREPMAAVLTRRLWATPRIHRSASEGGTLSICKAPRRTL